MNDLLFFLRFDAVDVQLNSSVDILNIFWSTAERFQNMILSATIYFKNVVNKVK